jgi:predicted RNA-binding protein YlqC (UPF0109 family)
MVADFILEYAKLIISYPDDLKIETKTLNDNFIQITILANETDVGKLIGKNGNMINSIKTIINGCKAKDNISYKLQVKTIK